MQQNRFTLIKQKIIELSCKDFSLKQYPYAIIKLFLFILSKIYGVAVFIRLFLYRKNIIKSKKVPCRVISIGNVVAGGSGKTPMAIYVAEMVKSMGFNPVVISRGYGGNFGKNKSKQDNSKQDKSKVDAVVVGDGNSVFQSPQVAGDEPFMMASRRSFPVVVGQDRFKAIIMTLGHFNSKKKIYNDRNQNNNPNTNKNIDIIILDDGFQHIQLKRDLDIVLMDYSRPLGNGHLLPAGRLREPPKKAIERADIVIFTRYPDDDLKRFDKSCVEKVVSYKGKLKTFFITRHQPFLYSFLHQTKPFPTNLNALKGRKGCLFSGIADNQSFRKTVDNLGVSVKAHLEFNDHHIYKSEEISMIIETYHNSGADLIITTEKDYARLGMAYKCLPDKFLSIDFAVIGVEIDFLDKKEEFKKIIKECCTFSNS